MTQTLLEGARKTDLFGKIPLPKEIYGQGVLDIYKSHQILIEKFKDKESLKHLEEYQPSSLSKKDYDSFIARQDERFKIWKKAHPDYSYEPQEE